MTDAQRIVDESALAPIQEALYATSRELLEDHDPDLPVAERINLPFKKRPDTETWNALCSKINAGPELGELIHSEAVLSAFEGIFGEAITTATASGVDFDTLFPATDLGRELKMVAQLIAGRKCLGNNRQIFFVDQGGYDTHQDINADLPTKLDELDDEDEQLLLLLDSQLLLFLLDEEP